MVGAFCKPPVALSRSNEGLFYGLTPIDIDASMSKQRSGGYRLSI
jgi:hypothetical protein